MPAKWKRYQKMCKRNKLHQYRYLCVVQTQTHTYQAPFYYLHMLVTSGIHPLESPSGNPPLWAAQTATTFSKLAKDIHVRYRSFSENYICEYSSQARFQAWTNSKFCLWKHHDNKPVSSLGFRLEVFVVEEDQTKNQLWQSCMTHSTHLSRYSPDKNITGLERASNPWPSCKTKGNRLRDLIFLKQRKTATWQCDANDSISRTLQSNGQEGEGGERE